MSDEDLPEMLRRRIRESGKSVTLISTESGCGYLKLVRWYNGRTLILDVRMVDKLMNYFGIEVVERGGQA